MSNMSVHNPTSTVPLVSKFLETCLKVAEENINTEDDALVVFIHWILVTNDFLCIGLGENFDVGNNAEKSELLPHNWSGGTNYAIRYMDSTGKLFILRGLKSEVNIIFNFVRADNMKVTSVSFNSKQEVKSLTGSINNMFRDATDLLRRIQEDMIVAQNPALSGSSSTCTVAAPEPTERDRRANPIRDPLMIGEPRRPPRVDPFNYGRPDLDPFANRGGAPGGGMLFDPFSENRGRIDPSAGLPGPGLPRGAVPPGARFDPFGPPDPNRDFGLRSPSSGPRLPGSGGNSDLLPPGYDDMFM